MKCKVVILACWSAAVAAFGADEVRLVEDGVAKCRVVVADDASRPEKFGARELATYFDKVTGCGALGGAYPIRVTVDAANPDLREDGFVLDVTPQGLTVTGANPRGALYGCYEILKRYAGMRWLVPGEDGEYCVHEGKSIVVPVGREVQNAYLRIRKTVANSEDAWLWHARNNMTCETGSWRFKDRRTGKPTKLASRLEELCVKGVATAGNSHILAEMMSGWAGAGSRAKMDALFAAHPEWFPLVGGRRVPICRANDPNPCVSNAGLLDLMASNLYERVRGPHGSDDYVTIGNNDTTTWCECEKCRALDAPELADTKGARADRYWHLVGEIARRVWARDPSIRLGGWCYQDFWYPPARVKIDPRLRVFVSFNNQCWRHAVDDEKCTVNAEWRRIYRAWSRLGLPLVVNRDEISTLGAPGSSFSPIERTLCKNVLAYPSFGCSGSSLCVYAPFEHKHIYQAAPYFGKSDRWYGIWQGCYMIARMMWSPSGTDVDRDLEEACRLYYGEAAWNGGMREFRRLLTAAWTRTPGCSGWGLGAPLGRCLDQAGVEDRLVAFMENAVKAAEASGDARAIAHVRRDGDMFELTWRKARKEYVENFKELTAYRQTDEIRIDGALDEADWRNADVLGNFSPSEMMRKTCPDAKIQPSFVRVVYSPETLYVAVECMEPSPEKMIACRALPGDATKVWPSLGEHVELFYNYPDMGDRYYHLIINAHGAYIAAVQQSAVVRTPLKTSAKWATKVLKDRWTLEVAIPTSEIGMKCFDGATWKLNVGRVRKSAGLSTPKNSETSSCCNGKFHGASNFVNVKFAPRRAEGLKQSASPSAWSNSGFEETRSNATLPKYYQWRAFTFPEGDDSVPAAWDGRTLRGQLLDEDGNRLVRILPGKDSRLSQYFVSASPGSVNIRFRLRGSGRVSMETALYTDSDGARGYRMQKGTMRTETFEATKAWRAVTVERTKNGLPTERLAVRFRALPGSQIDLDDVIVSPRPPPKPLAPFPFPDRLSACVWRNWGLVSVERLAETLGATADELTALAGEMGLKPAPKVLPAWRRKGYITIVRRNWHLLPEEQILRLIDMDAQEFAYRLKEDDFLWHKLGFLKPDCEPLKYTTAAAAAGRDARRRLVEILKEENVDPDAPEEPRFAFVDELKALDAARPPRPSRASPFTFRMISSYFADYGDPLADDEIGSFPEGLLQKLAHEGVNAVWMHVVLNTLVKDARYPEFGAGSERRRANLKRLVARAKKYGIKVYLYLNEPRCLSTAFFETDGRAAIRGAVEAEKGVAATCTSVPEVRRWLRDSLASLFSEVKGLGGVFTITMSENLTNCASHNRRETCPRCKGRPVSAILAEVNRTIAEGVVAGDPSAETIVWNWAWPKGVEKDVFPNLPKGKCRVMHVSENGIPVTVGGVTVPEHDYSIAVVGPGENARSFWRTARANGLPVLAKVQACNSWELSSFPFIPALDLVAEQAANLAREGVEGVMLSWSCGSAPAMNLRVYGGESLDEIAADVYGAAAAPFVRRAWTAYSEGFRRYPFDIVTVYKGPMQWGPANPLYPKATGYQATMVGFPYDALNFGTWDNQWHGRFPVEAWISRFDEVARGFAEGNRRFAEALAHVEPAKRAAAERDLAMFRAEEMHFRSTVDQSRFILARDAGDAGEMRRLALEELATAKAYLPLVRADGRIGYECSNHYYYVPRDVVEKILACRRIADAAKAAEPLTF